MKATSSYLTRAAIALMTAACGEPQRSARGAGGTPVGTELPGAVDQPIVWAREHGNWRSFYTAIGHDSAVFRDPVVKRHLTRGILWAVRRAHLLP